MEFQTMKRSDLEHASQSTKRLNPSIFGPVVGAVVANRPERNPVQALDGRGKERRQRKGCVVVRVVLITCRRRELDDDSATYALKPLRDAIAASLGLDDADARIEWNYGQQTTKGEQGVIVRIEVV